MSTFFKIFSLKLCLACLLVTPATLADVAIVVHPDNRNELDIEAVKRIFLGKQVDYPDGTPANPISQRKGSQLAEEFNQKVLNRSAKQLEAYWAKLIFTGKGHRPIVWIAMKRC